MCQSHVDVNKFALKTSCRLLVVSAVLFVPAAGFALSLDQAEKLALKSDPRVLGYQSTARSYEEASISDSTLPDPRLMLGAVNVPVDSFDLSQDAMTQLNPALALQLMVAFFGMMDLLFYAIALYYGYKLSFRQLTNQDLQQMLSGGTGV